MTMTSFLARLISERDTSEKKARQTVGLFTIKTNQTNYVKVA
ncbi:MAG: hypothetical protein ACI9SP_002382 [Arenicella sp.]|jgi:hypothetical protein